MVEKNSGAPSPDPVVTIGDRLYTLRFSFLAQYEADRLGVDLPAFVGGLKTRNTGTLAGFVALFSAMVAHNFPAGQQVPGPDHWAREFDKLTPSARSEIMGAVGQTLGQWLKERASEVIRLQEPAPAQGPTLTN